MWDPFLTFATPVIRKGWASPIGESDVPDVSHDMSSAHWMPIASAAWTAEVKANGSKASLLGVVWKLQRRTIVWGVFWCLVYAMMSTVARPLVLRAILSDLRDQDEPDTSRAIVSAVAVFVVVALEGAANSRTRQVLATQFSTDMFTWLSPLIMDKAPRVRPGSTELDPSSLIGNDFLRGQQDWQFGCLLPFAILGMMGGTTVLLVTVGAPALAGIGSMVLVLSCNTLLADAGKCKMRHNLKLSDKRIVLTKEAIQHMKAVKYLSWEVPYLDSICSQRARETHFLGAYRLYQVTNISLGRASPVFASCATFAVMAYSGTQLDSPTVFTVLAAFQGLRLPAIALPTMIAMWKNFALSVGRIRSYLLLKEIGDRPPLSYTKEDQLLVRAKGAAFSWHAMAEKPDPETPKRPSGVGSVVSSPTVTLPRSLSSLSAVRCLFSPAIKPRRKVNAIALPTRPTQLIATVALKDIDLVVRRGEMVAVVGEVGSGKTSLLLGLSGQLDLVSGECACATKVGFVSQKPFIWSGTLQDNIVMDSGYDAERFSEAIRVADLANDFDQFDRGPDTEVGERGMTLSGGQQQRVCIARCVYAALSKDEPTALLLDDPLAAVDASVGKRIFASLLSLVRESPVPRGAVMVVNQLSLLSQFDKIIMLHEGKVVLAGQATTVLAEDNQLSRLVRRFERSENGTALKDGNEAKKTSSGKEGGKEEGGGEGGEAGEKAQDGKSVKNGEREHSAPAAVKSEDLVKEEEKASGSHSFAVLKEFVIAMGAGGFWYLGVTLVAIMAYGLHVLQDIKLTEWVAAAEQEGLSRAQNIERNSVYTAIAVAYILSILLVSILNTFGAIRASRAIHNRVVARLLRAPMSWWESIPSGRVVSRLSGDLTIVDTMLCFFIDDLTHFLWCTLAVAILLCTQVPVTIVPLMMALPAQCVQSLAADRTNRETKRIANLNLAPVMTLLTESLSGRALVHSMDLRGWLAARHALNTDRYIRCSFFSYTVMNWSQLRSSLIASVVTGVTALVLCLSEDTYKPDQTPYAGLTITYAFLLPYFSTMFFIILGMCLMSFTGLQRLVEYKSDDVPQEGLTDIPSNPPAVLKLDPETIFNLADPSIGVASKRGKKPWPTTGALCFENVTLVYRPGLPPASRNVSFDILSGKKIGVVGRTGAGKSTLVALLFRIVEATEGRIMLDGRDTAGEDLRTLRRSCAIIPQEPVVLVGTVRRNLDPFGHFVGDEGTAQLREVLEAVGLWEPGVLDKPIGTGGGSSRLSVGELQLLALGRVLLQRHHVRLLVMDEPTAHLDMATDHKLQEVVRKFFLSTTVITIAHRLLTVVDSDKILVMDKGTVAEFDEPAILLRDNNGVFTRMVEALGPEAAAEMREKAREATEARSGPKEATGV